MYAAIQATLSPERNIITLEDPVEVQFPGITQVQINVKAGMTFAAGLRSVLRQDPDVVLVGETRDQETAELSLQASLTGHLVLTTLHTNDAVRAITRIVDMGVEPFLVASSLTLVVAQRLVRRVCPDCSAPHRPSPEVLALLGLTEHELEDSSPRVGTGCSNCAGSGYKGRTGIFEVLPVTAGLRAVLLDNPTEGALSAVAQAEGVATLRMSALAAARRGITTYEEVLRVTHIDAVDPSSETHCHTCTRQVEARDGLLPLVPQRAEAAFLRQLRQPARAALAGLRRPAAPRSWTTPSRPWPRCCPRLRRSCCPICRPWRPACRRPTSSWRVARPVRARQGCLRRRLRRPAS